MCAVRPLLDRVLPEPRSAADRLVPFATRLVRGSSAGLGLARSALRAGLIVATTLGLGVGIVAAGTPAREPAAPDTGELLNGVPHAIDPATLPAITVDVPAWDETIAAPVAQGILVTLGEDLELENQALLRSDPDILTAVDHGDRLREMQGRLENAVTSGRTTVAHYHFDSVHVIVIAPFGVQTGGSIGFESTGTLTEETYDAGGRCSTGRRRRSRSRSRCGGHSETGG